jgi:hypothetical protein
MTDSASIMAEDEDVDDVGRRERPTKLSG